jgi:hypothetical protein
LTDSTLAEDSAKLQNLKILWKDVDMQRNGARHGTLDRAELYRYGGLTGKRNADVSRKSTKVFAIDSTMKTAGSSTYFCSCSSRLSLFDPPARYRYRNL